MKPFNGTTALGLVLGSAGLAIFWSGVTHPGSEAQFVDLVGGIVGLGAGLAGIAAGAGWFDSPVKVLKPSAYWILAALLGAVVVEIVWGFGMRQVGGFDYSALIDPAWRTYSGQVAYSDFPITFPLFFIVGGKLAFKLFGVSWGAINAVNTLFALGTYSWCLWILTKLNGRRWTNFLWAVALEALTTAITGFWWYSTITATASVIYLLAAVLWLRQPKSIAATVSYLMALVLLSGMKPNSSGPLIILVSTVLFFSAPHRFKVVALSVGGFVIFYAVLLSMGVSLGAMMNNYMGVSGRLLSLSHFIVPGFTSFVESVCFLGSGLAVIAIGIPVAGQIISKKPSMLFNKATLIALSTIIVGTFGYIVNSSHFCDLCIMMFGAMFLVAELLNPFWTKYLLVLCIVIGAGGFALGACRNYVKSSGMSTFFEYDGDIQVMGSGFFKGIHCGKVLAETLREETEVITNGGTIWFGPSMQWGYAAFNQPSPKGQPIFWEPGTAFAAKDEDLYFQRFLDCHYQTLIFFKNTFTKFSQEKLSQLAGAYDVDQSPQVLTVLHLKK